MKKLLSRLFVAAAVASAETATAADLSKAPTPLFGWSGCYAGGAAGLGAGHVSWRDVSTPGDIDAKRAFNTANRGMGFDPRYPCPDKPWHVLQYSVLA